MANDAFAQYVTCRSDEVNPGGVIMGDIDKFGGKEKLYATCSWASGQHDSRRCVPPEQDKNFFVAKNYEPYDCS